MEIFAITHGFGPMNGLYLFGRPTPRFTRAGQVWVWSRGGGYYGADVVGGCKELSAGGDSCLCYYSLSARILYSRRRLEKHASRRRVQQFVGQKCDNSYFARIIWSNWFYSDSLFGLGLVSLKYFTSCTIWNKANRCLRYSR
jgi:hypothetical protein